MILKSENLPQVIAFNCVQMWAMCTMQQMFLQMFQVTERQNLTKYSLQMEAKDAADDVKHSTHHKCERPVLFSGRTWTADKISRDVESV